MRGVMTRARQRQSVREKAAAKVLSVRSVSPQMSCTSYESRLRAPLTYFPQLALFQWPQFPCALPGKWGGLAAYSPAALGTQWAIRSTLYAPHLLAMKPPS